MIDLYCERLGPELWAEPINALTNLAFLVAAWATWVLARRSASRSGEVMPLVVLMVVIGIGSALFHTYATTWARVLDVLPILSFQTLYIWVYSRRIISIGRGWSMLLAGGFLAAAIVGREFPAIGNGVLRYLPALLAFFGLAVYHYVANKQGQRLLLAASGLFLLALIFRTVDLAVCSHLAVGTHFLWHVLDAAVLYLATRALILNRTRDA